LHGKAKFSSYSSSDLGHRLNKIKAQRQADADADLDAEMRERGMAYGMRDLRRVVRAGIPPGVVVLSGSHFSYRQPKAPNFRSFRLGFRVDRILDLHA
jgi:hypothetical protein